MDLQKLNYDVIKTRPSTASSSDSTAIESFITLRLGPSHLTGNVFNNLYDIYSPVSSLIVTIISFL